MKLNAILLAGALLLGGSLSHAGMIETTCENYGGTIQISGGVVKILVTKYPEPRYEELFEQDLSLDVQSIQKMPTETIGCSSRSIEFMQIRLSKKDGTRMPDAYNQRALNFVLPDYFICLTSASWLCQK